MAADLAVEPRHDRRGSRALDHSVASTFDPALDSTIRQLFEQQADIQAKLSALLPAKYVPNSRLELGMLRRKLKALEAYAENQSQFKQQPRSTNQPAQICSLSPTDSSIQIYRQRHQSCLRWKKPGHCNTSASASRAYL